MRLPRVLIFNEYDEFASMLNKFAERLFSVYQVYCMSVCTVDEAVQWTRTINVHLRRNI